MRFLFVYRVSQSLIGTLNFLIDYLTRCLRNNPSIKYVILGHFNLSMLADAISLTNLQVNMDNITNLFYDLCM